MPKSAPINLSDLASLSPAQAIIKLSSHHSGLSDSEAHKRLRLYGPNRLHTESKKTPLLEYFKKFKDPLVLILFVVALVSAATGEVASSILVLLMIAMSTTLNFFQEHKASQAAAKLKAKVATTATLIRARLTLELPADKIVPGDIITLSAGDLVPADAILLESKDLFTNQSALTGESFPVEKHSQPVTKKNPDLTDLHNVVFSGTSVVTGTAKALVVNTGLSTHFGQIAKHLSTTPEDNDFTLGIKNFSFFILRIILIFVLIIFLINAIWKQDLLQSLAFAIAIAVGLTPEFLPMIMTVTMGRGSVAMAAKGVIVKRLTAIPTFGSMDILCTDKTGTLTDNHIKLVKYLDVAGNQSESVLFHAYLNSRFETGLKSPMDNAILEFQHLSLNGHKKVDEIPFDFYRKKSSVVVSTASKHLLITKGAPEEILRSCRFFDHAGHSKPISVSDKKSFLRLYRQLSSDGFRVLAVARKSLPASQPSFSTADETAMTLLGFTAFLDPAKSGVKASIDLLEAMGIEVKIITGDNELVTQKICSDVGVEVKGVMLGKDLDHYSTNALRHQIEHTTIFARFSPDQKTRIIELLRHNGHVVGYMGDGINDAPSLQSADVGISVNNAVDVAKESADLILTHKSLRQLSDGVSAGRQTFGNTMKYVQMGLSSNFGNMFSVLGAVILLPFLPMLPIQILLNNFLYDMSQLTIPTDSIDPEYVRTPKRWDTKFIRRFMLVFGPLSSIFDYLTFGLLYLVFASSPSLFQTGWFIQSVATQTLVIHIIRTKRTPFLKSLPSPYLILSTVGITLLGWLIPYTPIGSLFGFVPLPGLLLLGIAAIVALYLLSVEITKTAFYHYHDSHP